MITKTTKIITENSTSAENATVVGGKVREWLVVGKVKGKINKITPTTSLLEPHYVENSKRMTRNQIKKNGWEAVVRCCIYYTRRRT